MTFRMFKQLHTMPSFCQTKERAQDAIAPENLTEVTIAGVTMPIGIAVANWDSSWIVSCSSWLYSGSRGVQGPWADRLANIKTNSIYYCPQFFVSSKMMQKAVVARSPLVGNVICTLMSLMAGCMLILKYYIYIYLYTYVANNSA